MSERYLLAVKKNCRTSRWQRVQMYATVNDWKTPTNSFSVKWIPSSISESGNQGEIIPTAKGGREGVESNAKLCK